MWKISCFLTAFLLSSFVIDETFCASISRSKSRRTNPSKVQSLNSLCHILNYGEFNHPGLTTHTLNIANEPIHTYQTGHQNRVEYVHATVTTQSIQSGGSAPNTAARTFARAMGKPTDDAGHIIANRLGGTGRQLYNIFPQSPNINRGAWSQEEKAIHDLVLQTNQPIEVVVQLYYSSPTATRPDHFIYRAAYNNACMTATVINP